jgi:hypothetical protein
MTAEHQQIFVLRLRIACQPGAAGLHALRALLKRLLRQHGFICLHAHEERDAAASDVTTAEETATARRASQSPAPTATGD